MSHRVMTAPDTTAAQLLAATVNPTIWLPLTGPAEFSVDVTSAPIRFDLTDATTTPVSVVAATELTDCSTTSHRPEDPIPVNAAVQGVVNRTEVTGLRSQRANVARTKAGLSHSSRAGFGVCCTGFDGALTPLREADDIESHRPSPTRGRRLREAAGQGGEGT